MTKISNYYDHELNQFYDAMRLKLHIHRKKGKWEGASLDKLFTLLVEEVQELKETIEDGNQIALILEAADVANYAMIIANVAMKIAAGGHKEETVKVHSTHIFDTHTVTRVDDVPVSKFVQAPELKASSDEIKKALGR